MNATSPLAQRCYRTFLKTTVEQRNKAGEDMSFSKIAQHTKIQRTYLSQVIHLKAHLNNDQLYAICKTLQLSSEIRQHLIILSEWERSKLKARKKLLEQQLKTFEQKSSNSHGEPLGNDAFDDYFCDPLGEITLKFLSLDTYRQAPHRIQERLGISSRRLHEILTSIEACGLIEWNQQEIKVLKTPAYPQELSAAGKIRNIQGRLKVAHQKLKQRNIDEFLYNWWIIACPSRKKQLKIAYLRLLQDIYQESLLTRHDDVYQLSLDLFTP